MCSKDPAWKQLISHSLTMEERVFLITTIFLDHNQVEMVGQLSGNDAQAFVDAIDVVSCHAISHSRGELTVFDTGFRILSIRCWITSPQKSAEGAAAIYTLFVAAKPCFRDRWQLHFVMTQQRTRFVMVDLRTCGRVDIKAGRLQPRF